MKNIVNNPYKVLFKDLFEKGIEMKNLNTKIIEKNRELEFSQKCCYEKGEGF
ncbi:hypothetical protein [Clostridium paraputrificum]|uniref:hypothetical protein n=1 Tax=Clostridium paraputrificum TaxID=29363 RepID=UPI00155897A9|nr:hypothetical protein [Clostridium paraputrificum]